MERVARRLIQTARLAAAEHAAGRLREAVRRRDQSLEGLVGDGPADQDRTSNVSRPGAA
jgi:hypothetical protein